ncbi:MAG: ribosomal-protein-alanine N-acetyltransferase [Pseudomonadota bacterium]|jgi:ribosomal-protein-alanine N-acetyltransferase
MSLICQLVNDPQDLINLATIDQQVNLTPWSLTSYQQALNNKHYVILGLYYENRLIGGCVYSKIIDEAEILQLCISANYQRRGYANFLLTQLSQQLRQSLIEQVFLEVMVNNQAAINLYHKLGFNIISCRKNYYKIKGATYDAWLMALNLS